MSTLSQQKEQSTGRDQRQAGNKASGQGPALQQKEGEAAGAEDLQMKPKAAPALQMKCAACGGDDDEHGQVIQRQAEAAAPGQTEMIRDIPKAEFFELLKERLCNDLNALFAGTPYTATNCPWIRFWVDYYSNRPAAEVEAAINRYIGNLGGDTIQHISDRVQVSVRHWLRTGEITGIPDGQIPQTPSCDEITVQQKGGNTMSTADPQQVQAQLGTGQTMAGHDASRFGQAFGGSFGDVRIHTDSTAVQLSKQLGARAFTVGNHIAFNSGEYRPGSITGDALMAHELAHVQQQRGGETRGLQSKGSSSYGALETDADNTAVGIIGKLWGQSKEFTQGIGQRTGAALRTGLRLQGCPESCNSSEQEREQNPQPPQRSRNITVPTPLGDCAKLNPEFEQQQSANNRMDPEDASYEMVCRTFTLRRATTVTGGVALPAGAQIVILQWNNSSRTVSARVRNPANNTIINNVDIDKANLTVPGNASGLYRYSADVAGQQGSIDSLEQRIAVAQRELDAWVAREGEFRTNRAFWEQGRDQRKGVLDGLKWSLTGGGTRPATAVTTYPRYDLLNKQLIEETLFNAHDERIVHWVNHYNRTIGTPAGWDALDANIVKSMIFQESSAGTSGRYMRMPDQFQGNPTTTMTRFNLMQSIDSKGEIFLIMIQEVDNALYQQHNLQNILPNLSTAKRSFQTLVQAEEGGTITAQQQGELNALRAIVMRGGRATPNWDWWIRAQPDFSNAFNTFINTNPVRRNMQYDFWIRTGVRWLFEKRRILGAGASWADAIRAFNGSGADARAYRDEVIRRRNEARTASRQNNQYVPSH